jgi:hypothetical protein
MLDTNSIAATGLGAWRELPDPADREAESSPYVEPRGPVDRLGEPGTSCQLYVFGKTHKDDGRLDCGAPDAHPARISSPPRLGDSGSTLLRLCPACFAKVGRARPVAWLDELPQIDLDACERSARNVGEPTGEIQ